jgi:hypothetical protein
MKGIITNKQRIHRRIRYDELMRGRGWSKKDNSLKCLKDHMDVIVILDDEHPKYNIQDRKILEDMARARLNYEAMEKETDKLLPFREFIDGRTNLPDDEVHKNIRKNLRLPLPQAHPYSPQKDVRILLVCGGPSSKKLLPEIKQENKDGWKIATVNGSHNWIIDEGLEPKCHIMLDARRFNARFVENPLSSCRYLVASQCDPQVFQNLKGHDVTIFHSVYDKEAKIVSKYYNNRFWHIKGGTTVGTRALYLLHALGFRKIAVYGMDSCLTKDFKHHAYDQPENDQTKIWKVRVGRRLFYLHQWMAVQVDEILRMIPWLPDDLELDFRGGGLISYVIKYVAENGKPPKMTIVEEDNI